MVSAAFKCVPQRTATTFAFSSAFIRILWYGHKARSKNSEIIFIRRNLWLETCNFALCNTALKELCVWWIANYESYIYITCDVLLCNSFRNMLHHAPPLVLCNTALYHPYNMHVFWNHYITILNVFYTYFSGIIPLYHPYDVHTVLLARILKSILNVFLHLFCWYFPLDIPFDLLFSYYLLGYHNQKSCTCLLLDYTTHFVICH